MPNWRANRPYRSWASNFQTSLPSRSVQASSPLPVKNQTCLPSVDGDAVAPITSGFRLLPGAFPRGTFHNSLPAVLTHMATTAGPSSLVRKMRSPQAHGVEAPFPGIGSFQSTFLVSLHSAGTPVASEMPSFFGPRHCGQLAAHAEPVSHRTSAKVRTWRFMQVGPGKWVAGGSNRPQG